MGLESPQNYLCICNLFRCFDTTVDRAVILVFWLRRVQKIPLATAVVI